ncbi:MAG TPA: hypothetical protein VES97_03305, partial [Solirubrobacteraceae bacterium]|nr:hypothetical protein [Solirubrobacteraceae bacterium]
CLCAATTAVVLALPAGAHAMAGGAAAEGPAAIAILNQQRAANGIPPITTVRQSFAEAWCPNEDGGPSGGENARIYAPGSDLWGPDVSPWDAAPLHQEVMYNPLATEAGEVNRVGGACVGVKIMRGPELAPSAFPAPKTYAYVGDEGPRNVPFMLVVGAEGPFAPSELIGIPATQATGPQPIFWVYGLGPSVHAVSWSLTTTGGTVVSGVKMVDSDAPASQAQYLYEVGWMVPPPLKPRTTYVANVLWEGSRGATTQIVSFTTSAAPNEVEVNPGSAAVEAYSRAPGGLMTLSKGRHTLTFKLTHTKRHSRRYYATVQNKRIPQGRWLACVASGGEVTSYLFEERCVTIGVGRRYHGISILTYKCLLMPPWCARRPAEANG